MEYEAFDLDGANLGRPRGSESVDRDRRAAANAEARRLR